MTADMAFATASEGMLKALEASPELAALGPEGLAELQRRAAEAGARPLRAPH